MHNPKRLLIHASLYLLLISTVALALSCSSRSSRDRAAAPAPAPTPFDYKGKEFSVRLLDGTQARLTDLVGNNKVVLVNFWATWCEPCRTEIPELIALQRDFKDKGVEVIGLSVDEPDTAGDVKTFVEKMKINYKIGFTSDEMFMLFNGEDPQGLIPQTFIFDRSGKLVDSMKGFRRDFRNRVEGSLNYALNNS